MPEFMEICGSSNIATQEKYGNKIDKGTSLSLFHFLRDSDLSYWQEMASGFSFFSFQPHIYSLFFLFHSEKIPSR